MTTKTIMEQIIEIAPKFRPDNDDISWFETELEKAAKKALPRLIKKRFAQSFMDIRDNKASSPAAGVVPFVPKQVAGPTNVKP